VLLLLLLLLLLWGLVGCCTRSLAVAVGTEARNADGVVLLWLL